MRDTGPSITEVTQKYKEIQLLVFDFYPRRYSSLVPLGEFFTRTHGILPKPNVSPKSATPYGRISGSGAGREPPADIQAGFTLKQR